MEQVWGLVALIGAAQILNSVKQLKNSRREMFKGGGTYTLFLFSNLLNILSMLVVIYGVFFTAALFCRHLLCGFLTGICLPIMLQR